MRTKTCCLIEPNLLKGDLVDIAVGDDLFLGKGTHMEMSFGKLARVMIFDDLVDFRIPGDELDVFLFQFRKYRAPEGVNIVVNGFCEVVEFVVGYVARHERVNHFRDLHAEDLTGYHLHEF